MSPRSFCSVLLAAFLCGQGILPLLAAPPVRATRMAALAPDRAKSGTTVLRAFTTVVKSTKDSVVQFELDGKPAALGTVIDAEGLTLTKASELRTGKLSARLHNGQRVEAEVLVIDDDNDVALVKLSAPGLKPIEWANQRVLVGQWAITPGIEANPEAVGIVSTPPRKILPKQAYLGVGPDFDASNARIASITPGFGAEQAGLRPGDVILAVNSALVRDPQDLVSKLRQFRDGQKVKVKVQRDDEIWEVDVPMSSLQPDRRWRRFNRQERMNHLGGELSQRAEGFQSAIQHDSVLQPWQCGGPLLNVEGKAVGLNIARAGRVASYALPATLVQQLIQELKNELKVPVKQEDDRNSVH
jgi:serine protease Do